MREIAETLEKWTGLKLKNGVEKRAFAGKIRSEVLIGMFREAEVVDINEVMRKVNGLVGENNDGPRRKPHQRH